MSGVHCVMVGSAAPKTQVTFNTAGAGATGAAGSIAVPYPASLTAGMMIILHVYANDATAASVTTPAGFTAITDTGAGVARMYAFYKISDGTETGNLTVSYTGSVAAAGRMYSTTRSSGYEAAAPNIAAGAIASIPTLNLTTTMPLELGVQLQGCLLGGSVTTLANSTGETLVDYTQPVALYSSGTAIMLGIQTGVITGAGGVPVVTTGGSASLGAAKTQRATICFAVSP